MRVLLSEGSGLTSRQVASRLGALGHHVEILSSTPFCLTRFTRHVRAVHEVPRFADDPVAWFDAANDIAKARDIDVLLPTQEQVAVLSALQPALEVASVSELFKVRDFLRSKGVEIFYEGRRGPGGNPGVEFYDPDGYKIEIYSAMDQIGTDGRSRPANEWKRATTLEEAVSNPLPGAEYN